MSGPDVYADGTGDPVNTTTNDARCTHGPMCQWCNPIGPQQDSSTTFAAWLDSERTRIGTHHAACYTHHPACAAILAERAERAAIVAYLRDGERIGGSADAQLMASVLSDYIERGEHHADPTRTNGGEKLA